ncbi:MAG: nitrate reductase cytochrome c-type subunit; periplasmic nitrate reductase electron transfer subunit [Gammaproteobacteria bacterium]|nr:nitrate reductase cytochrome c-type subunit; periplasmic nitrate reductase electron transfer subunit [Gammaproteobacteria bacterium]
MKKITTIVVLLVTVGFGSQTTAETVSSLRGASDIDQGSSAPTAKRYNKDGEPIVRDYVQQPPLIPHKIQNYRINLKSNKCMSCHSWSNYREAGATKISQTHFESRDKNVLANVSARRYFCTQCHVPQVGAKPLVGNSFQPVTAITGH